MLCVFEMVQTYPLLDSMRPFEMMFHKMNLCSKQPAVGQTKTPSSVEIQRDTGRDTSHVPSKKKNDVISMGSKHAVPTHRGKTCKSRHRDVNQSHPTKTM